MSDLTSEDLHLLRAIEGLMYDTQEPSKDPWKPNSASFRYAADVLHALIGEVEAKTPEADVIEALRWEADRADADAAIRIRYPHLSPAEQAPMAEQLLGELTARRHAAVSDDE
ncbi:hypothetical protein [Tsukamurella spumae]|uniref:Uncharacterized protein n=1 Tax=Tsukamurella spumae TaxID=44753 RepID=A0A846X6Y2_9ACTN|nr:hypothetical protein [Tsukamurella spumae]NKY19530.1 hypothetical protein [Tsukamurella spumae]